MHQRGIGAPVGLVPHVGDGKREIDKAMAGERERYVVERLQQRADSGGTALARPCVQSGLMLEARLASCRKIAHARLVKRHIRKCRLVWRLVVDLRAAKRGSATLIVSAAYTAARSAAKALVGVKNLGMWPRLRMNCILLNEWTYRSPHRLG